MLEQHEDFISGADIAGALGVSGTAVWKAVNKLRSEGYMIEAVTNKGYKLCGHGDVLSMDTIRNYLHDKNANGLKIEVFDSIDSTNNVCKSRAEAGEKDGYVAVSANQTGGRGRRGRSFFSPAGTGLYMSFLLRPAGYTARQALRFTTIAAVSVCEAIEEVSGRDAGIKWVNDIFMEGRKVCGILTEASFDLESGGLDYAVVGIGINVFTPDGGFPEAIRDVAGSVFNISRVEYDGPGDARSRLAAAVISHFMARYHASDSDSKDYISEYRKRCVMLGRKINILMPGADPVSAEAIDIDDECGLIVRYTDGSEETLRSGEISIRF